MLVRVLNEVVLSAHFFLLVFDCSVQGILLLFVNIHTCYVYSNFGICVNPSPVKLHDLDKVVQRQRWRNYPSGSPIVVRI